MKRFYPFLFLLLTIFSCKAKKPVLLFDLSHGQFQDTFFDPAYYDYVIPGYKEILSESGIEYKEVKDSITPEILKEIDVLLMLSPLSRSTQIPIKESEKKTIIDYIHNGGSVIIMVDEESHRVILDEYGANDITEPFGILLGEDIEDVPGNCGAISFINEIFSDRLEVPYSGSRHVIGGIPASVCMEGGHLHGTFTKLDNGGKLFVIGETMVGLLMGQPNGERNTHNMQNTKWWGKDSRQYMKELIEWSVKK